MRHKPIIQKVVLAAVIIKNNRVLILQRSKDEDIFPNMWELPSGKRKFSESSEESLTREVKEETGLNIEIVMPIYVFDYQARKPEKIIDSTQINFLVRPSDNKKVILSSEHQAFAWINKKEISRYRISRATQKTIKKAFEWLPTVVK